MKAFISRCGMVSQANGHMLQRKIGATAVAVRRSHAGHPGYNEQFFLLSKMILVGSGSWNVGIGPEKFEVVDDEERMKNMRLLGENMIWLLKQIHA